MPRKLTADEINILIGWRLGKKIDIYNGEPLSEQDAQPVIDEIVAEYESRGDTLVLPTSPLKD